ncbi:hypothetical protein MYAM1_002066 [Malassezia yamatoensis]|uniref:Rab-GAP TBC domain-containing protein n=1 Tax=Malassezia yamatoensis TaxID=253288 RepID=A0AAJ5YXB4_9BASI|nr:hypothetical protein MYAM1_002066 [Malassezia yamatoensis]
MAGNVGQGDIRGPLYSMAWRVYLQDWPIDQPKVWISLAETQRRAYQHLCKRIHRDLKPPSSVSMEDPLQSDSSGASTKYREKMQMQDQIQLDVDRLVELNETDGKALKRLLFVWSCINMEIGYRQGMHEIARFLWQLRESEHRPTSIHEPAKTTMEPRSPEDRCLDLEKDTLFMQSFSQDEIGQLLSAEEVEADTFYLASSLFQRLAPYYTATRAASPALLRAILHRVDCKFSQHLLDLQFDWQPILLKWHRLLFLNVFAQEDTKRLWHECFQVDPKLELIPYLSLVIVLSMRERLMNSSYTDAMQTLMHQVSIYVSIEDLVAHSEALRAAPTPETASSIIAVRQPNLSADRSLVAKARERFQEIADSNAHRLALDLMHRSLLSHRTTQPPEWSPRTEDRLHADKTDKDTQRRRAMLSLDQTNK